MVAPDQVDVLGVQGFEGQEETNGFEGVTASVNEIPQEDVIEVLNVVLLAVQEGAPEHPEEVQKVGELAVDVPKDLHWCLD